MTERPLKADEKGDHLRFAMTPQELATLDARRLELVEGRIAAQLAAVGEELPLAPGVTVSHGLMAEVQRLTRKTDRA